MRIIGTGTAMLLLAACGGGAENNAVNAAPANATQPANVVAPAAANAVAPAPTADLAGARALIDRLYTSYTRGEAPAMEDVYTAELERSVARQSDADNGLGFDPFCQCQDFENFRYTIQSLEPTANGATARLDIRNMTERFTLTLELRRNAQGRWQVQDIIGRNGSLLRGGR